MKWTVEEWRRAVWLLGLLDTGGGGRGVNVPMRTYFLSACKIVLRVFRSIDS